MEIIEINQSNCDLLREFISKDLSPHFRYFKSRTIETSLPSHLYTIVLRSLDTSMIVGYGHLDKDVASNKVWLGICILDRNQGNGFGNQIMNALITKAKQLKLESIFLTVDQTNYKARLLYYKFGFCEIVNINNSIQMELKFSLELPVSYGEAFDKLTILDIKLEKIKDSRRDDVQKEYDAIFEKINPLFNINVMYHYNILKDINLRIWEMQDTFRDSSNIEEKNKLCNEIIIDNDRRFRVKHKINYLLGSHLKEQKGYTKRCIYVQDTLSNGLIRYYSTLYDEVIVQCTEETNIFADDPSIKLVSGKYIADFISENKFDIDEKTIRKYHHIALHPV